MKRVILVFMSLMFIMCLVGCGENQTNADVDLSEINIIKDVISSLNNNGEDTTIPDWNLENKIFASKSNKLMMYNFTPNIDTIEYIAGYYKEIKDPNEIDLNEIQWYNFDTINEINKEYNDFSLAYVFLVIEGKLIKNYSNNEIINKNAKYFYKIENIDNFKQPTIYDNNFIWALSMPKLEQIKNEYKVDYYPITCNRKDDISKFYQLINESGEDYIQLIIGRENITTNQYVDYTIDEFGEYYNYISEIMKKNEAYNELKNEFKIYFVLISVSDLKK